MIQNSNEFPREYLVFPKSRVKLHDISRAFEAAGIPIIEETTKLRMLTVVATPHDIEAAGGNRVRYEPNHRQTLG
ncbi:MAG: hypothetical protein DYH13_04550 [Alphaproteobacteria bacterium PRO2]|nr:hypothetical protein [Alphaproteobacteria bacterium PRO2]